MRLLDLVCANCGLIFEDVWNDEVPAVCSSCGSGSLNVVYLRSAVVDAFEPKVIPEIRGRAFSSHREMEKHAKATGQTLMSKKEEENLRKHTVEERLASRHGALREAVQKSVYRVKHGYVDHKPMEKETT